jgi:Phage protein Gp138 N-terminal domain
VSDMHANPSRDPANDDSLLGMARQILDKVSYDRTANRAAVVPLVKLLTTDNRQIGRAQVASVPVMQLGGGNVGLSFNLVPGDLGWIKANDRDISLVLQAYRDNAPNTLRKHSFQDAVFIPDVMRGMIIASEDEGNAVLQTKDGAVKIAIWPDRIKMAAGALSVTIGPATVDFVGHVNMPDGATIGGIEFGTHVHTGVDVGPGNTGGPV